MGSAGACTFTVGVQALARNIKLQANAICRSPVNLKWVSGDLDVIRWVPVYAVGFIGLICSLG